MKKEQLPDHFVIDDSLWRKLRDSDPEIICRDCEVFFDSHDRSYAIPVLVEDYRVFPWEEKIVRLPGAGIDIKQDEIELALFLLHYLVGAKNIQLKGELVSEKDIKGGEMFFRGPHSFPVGRIIKLYGKKTDDFIRAGERLGGLKIDLGDASIELKPAPKIPITYVLWAEDEEFPSSVSLLFDPTIQEFLPLDIIYGITTFVYKRLIEKEY